MADHDAPRLDEDGVESQTDFDAAEDAVDSDATEDAVDSDATEDAVDSDATEDAVDSDATEDEVDSDAAEDEADRVILSYRSPDADPEGRAGWVFGDSDRAREALNDRSYRAYLRRARTGPVAAGDEWEEFLGTGCGGRTDVILRAERVEGGSALGPGTEIEIVPRESPVE